MEERLRVFQAHSCGFLGGSKSFVNWVFKIVVPWALDSLMPQGKLWLNTCSKIGKKYGEQNYDFTLKSHPGQRYIFLFFHLWKPTTPKATNEQK